MFDSSKEDIAITPLIARFKTVRRTVERALAELGIAAVVDVKTANGQITRYSTKTINENFARLEEVTARLKAEGLAAARSVQRSQGGAKTCAGGPGRLSTGVYLRLDTVDAELKAVSTLLKLIAVKVGVPIV